MLAAADRPQGSVGSPPAAAAAGRAVGSAAAQAVHHVARALAGRALAAVDLAGRRRTPGTARRRPAAGASSSSRSCTPSPMAADPTAPFAARRARG